MAKPWEEVGSPGIGGAPGSTADDRAAGIYSPKDITVNEEGKNRQIVPPTDIPARDDTQNLSMSTEDKPWESVDSSGDAPWNAVDQPTNTPPSLQGDMLSSAKQAGRELGAAADTVLGALGFTIETGAAIVSDVGKFALGDTTSFKDTNQALDDFNQTKFGKFMMAPLASIGLDESHTLVHSLFKDIGDGIQKASDSVDATTGDTERGELAKQFFNIAMVATGHVSLKGISEFRDSMKKDPVATANGDFNPDILPELKPKEDTSDIPYFKMDPYTGDIVDANATPDVNAIPKSSADKLTMEAKASGIPDLQDIPKASEQPKSVDDGYIPFEKVDPGSLKTRQSEFNFDNAIDFTTHATPEQGAEIISHIPTDTTDYNPGEPAQFDLPGINEPAAKSRMGGVGKKQGGAVDLGPLVDFIKGLSRDDNTLKVTRSLDDELSTHRNMNIRDEVNVNKAYQDAVKNGGLTPEMDRKFIDVLENPSTKLDPHEQTVFNNIVPHAINYVMDSLDAYNTAGGKDIEYDPSIFPRFAIGKGGIMDRLLDASRTGNSAAILGNRSITPSITHSRTTFALEHPDGTREVITVGNGKYVKKGKIRKVINGKNNVLTSWDNGKPTPIATFNGPLKLGQKLEGGAYDGAKITQATFDEANTHTDTKYFPSAVEGLLRKGQELRAATRVLETVNRLKTDPEFKQFAKHVDDPSVPDNWKRVNTGIPALRDWKFEPNIAETLQDYVGDRIDNTAVRTLELVQNGILKAMFLWPLPHIANEGAHWIPSRGLEGWFTPDGMKDLQKYSGPAIESVLKQDSLQHEISEAGGQLLYPQVYNELYWKNRLKDVAKTLPSQPLFRRLAKELGVAPFKLTGFLSDKANQVMWSVRDMMITQLYIQGKENNPNLSPKEIMAEIERHMPNYRIPNRVVGSRSLAVVMKQPLLSVFSYYHYGMVKSFAEFGKSLAAPIRGSNVDWRSAKSEFLDGASKAAMLGVMYAILYPAADKAMKALTGVEGSFRRAGGLALIDKVKKLVAGDAAPQDLVRSVITPAPGGEMAYELLFNRDAFTGQKVNGNLHNYLPEKFSPLRTAGEVMKGKHTTKEAALQYFTDYKAKTIDDIMKEAMQ